MGLGLSTAARFRDPYSGFSHDPLKEREERSGGGTRASDLLNQIAPVPKTLDEEAQQGILSSAADMGLGALGAFGNFLDVPGSMVRDIAALENPFDQALPWNWFSDRGRTTGRQLLENWGVAGKNDPNQWFEGGDIGGFGLEVAMDPLSYFSFGLTGLAKGVLGAAGKAASKAGILRRLPQIAEATGKFTDAAGAIRKVGPREARGKLTLRDILNDPGTLAQFGGKGGLRYELIKGAVDDVVLKKADDAAQEIARNAGDSAIQQLGESATDAAKQAARNAAEDAAWKEDGIAARAFRAIVSREGKDTLRKIIDDPLGGGARLDIPFYGGVGSPFSPTGGRFSRGLDVGMDWASDTWAGRAVSAGFESAASGHFGKFARQVSRLSSHYNDFHMERAHKAVADAAEGFNEAEMILQEYVGDSLAKYTLGDAPSGGLSVGDMIQDSDMASPGRLMGQVPADDAADAGKYILRVFNPETSSYQNVLREIADPESARKYAAGSDEASEATNALVKEAMHSFVNASAEEGVEGALGSWVVSDIFEDQFKFMDQVPGGAAVGQAGIPLGSLTFATGRSIDDPFKSVINSTLDKAYVALKAQRDDLVARGERVGVIGFAGTRVGDEGVTQAGINVKHKDLSDLNAQGAYDPFTGEVYVDPDTLKSMSRDERVSLIRHELAHKIETDDELWKEAETFLWSLWGKNENAPIFQFMSEMQSATGPSRKFSHTNSAEIIANLYADHYEDGFFPHFDPLRGDVTSRIPPKIMEVLDKIEARIGTWKGPVGGIDYFPRRVTAQQAERVGRRAGQVTSRRFFGAPVPQATKEARDFSTFLETTAGRAHATAHVPKHILERMYADPRVKSIIDAEDAEEVIEELSNLIQEDSVYSKYLTTAGQETTEVMDDIVRDLPADVVKSKHAEQIAESLITHSGKGKMYMSDAYLVFAKHSKDMRVKKALLDGMYATLSREINLGTGAGSEDTVLKALKAMNLDASKNKLSKAAHKKKLIDEGVVKEMTLDDGSIEWVDASGVNIKELLKEPVYEYKGRALDHLAEIMGKSDIAELADTAIPEDLVRQLTATHVLTQPGEIQKKLLSTLDKVTGMFKSNVTLPFVSFAMRNHLSGQFVNLTSGDMANAADMLLYMKMMREAARLSSKPSGREYRRLMKEIQGTEIVEGRQHFSDVPKVDGGPKPFADTGLEDAAPGSFWFGEEGFLREGAGARTLVNPLRWGEQWDEATGHVRAHPTLRGALDSGPLPATAEPGALDFSAGGSQPLNVKPTLGKTRTTHRFLLGAGSHLNRKVEWANRIPMYLYLRKKGYSVQAAAERVKELQFDYSRLAPFEKKYMKRAMPFYAFTRKMAPLFATTLMEKPGGALGQTIRLSRVMSGDRQHILPEYIGSQTSIPFFSPKEEGAASYITGLGLAHEDPISYLGGLSALGRGEVTKFGRRGFSEILSRTNPVFKTPFEYLTGQSFFQTGPSGAGRPLEEMDPVLGRIGSNIVQGLTGVQQKGKPSPAFGSPLLEATVSGSPLSRYTTTFRQITDPRKGLGEKALNFITGLKTTTLSPYQLDYASKQAMQEMAKEGGYGRVYENPYIDRYALAEMFANGRISEEEFRRALDMQSYYRGISKGRRGDRESQRLERVNKIKSSGAF